MYTMQYRPGNNNAQADALSCSPHQIELRFKVDVKALQLEQIEQGPIKVTQMRQAMRGDPKLSRIVKFILRRWPSNCPFDSLSVF